MKVALLTGTHHQPFDALVWVGGQLAEQGHTVWVQAGTSSLRPAGCEVVDLVSPQVLQQQVAGADLVICHAGPGSIRAAWAAGHHPIVLPRDPARGEHVDDHQLRYAALATDRVFVVLDPAQVLDSLEVWRGWTRDRAVPVSDPDARAAARRRFAQLVRSVGRAASSRRRGR